jgi:hypothetical protein
MQTTLSSGIGPAACAAHAPCRASAVRHSESGRVTDRAPVVGVRPDAGAKEGLHT